MKKLNNLLGAVHGLPSDEEIFAEYGGYIADFKSDEIHNRILFDYIKGMLMMSMHDLNYTDGDIEDVLNEINEHYWKDKESDILTWEHTHILEKPDEDYTNERELTR